MSAHGEGRRGRGGRVSALTAALGASLLACALTAGGASAQLTTWDGVFTAEQAGRGEAIYGAMCAQCHGPQLGGVDAAPALNGGAFFANWNGIALGEMADRVRISMPANSPGTLNRQQVVDVLAYIFSRNGMPPGSVELPRQSTRLRNIVFRATRS